MQCRDEYDTELNSIVFALQNVAAKGRVPYAILAIMDVLRSFPGQVPDLDAVLHTADFPCIKRGLQQAGSAMTLEQRAMQQHKQGMMGEPFEASGASGSITDAPANAQQAQQQAPLPVIFGYSSSDGHADLLFPDYSFWGHERQLIQVGRGLQHWTALGRRLCPLNESV